MSAIAGGRKSQFLAHLQEGESVSSYFVLERAELRPFRAGGRYAEVLLADTTGQMAGRIWEQAETWLQSLQPGDVVWVEGTVERFRDELQLNISSLRKMEKGYTLRDLVRVSEKDVRKLYQDLLDTIATLQDEALRALLERIFQTEEIKRAFMRHPAAKGLHHGYLGGLLEHVMNIVALAESLCRQYPQLNRDLLLAGVLLHDIGKLWELEAGTRIEYTLEGRMVGHVVLGYEKVMEFLRECPDFPTETKVHLGHLILSHHGELEFGSPIKPATPEAIALHHLENLDAQVQRFYDVQRMERGKEWTYDRTKERWLYLAGGGEEAGIEP